jgi:hypothetical protein
MEPEENKNPNTGTEFKPKLPEEQPSEQKEVLSTSQNLAFDDKAREEMEKEKEKTQSVKSESSEVSQKESVASKAIHTLSGDMTSAVGTGSGGIVKKIIAEQERKEEETKEAIRSSRLNKLYLFLTILLILGSILAVFLIFFKDSASNLFNRQSSPSLIFYEYSEGLDITNKNKGEIFDILYNQVQASELLDKEIQALHLLENDKKISFYRLLDLFNSKLIEEDTNLFDNSYLVGIIKDNSKIGLEQEEKEIVEDYITLSELNFFNAGTVEFIDQESKDEAKVLISHLLDTIKFNTSKIQVVGTYATEKPWDRNLEIAENRRETGVKLLYEVLNEKYSQEEIDRVAIESIAKGVSLDEIFTKEEIEEMTDKEKEARINLNQGIQYKVEPIDQIEETEEGFIVEESFRLEDVDSKYPPEKDVFILIEMNSFADIFNQMRDWENKMFYDLHGFFGVEVYAGTSYLLEKDFEDEIVQNKNARILYDDSGEIIFMYIFVDDNHILFTSSENTAKEIINRINSSKIKK